MRRASVTLLFVLLVVGCAQPGVSQRAPTLDVSVEWPEQKIPNDRIHKTRVPRGGTIEVIARIDARDVEPSRRRRAGVMLQPPPVLKPEAVFVDGTRRDDPAEPLVFPDIRNVREIRWRFQLPWESPPEAWAFGVAFSPGRPFGTLRKSVTVEQGISCYDTTFSERLHSLAEDEHCRLETIGNSSFGRPMYLLRVTDFSIPAAKKKPFVMIGAYHGNEPSGHESILDFVDELIYREKNAHYLAKCELYVVPCMNPDGREAGTHDHPNGTDMNECFTPEHLIPEATNVMAVLRKYKPEIAGGLGMTTHQWNRPYLLLSHDPRDWGDWSDLLMRNVGIRVSNEMNEYVHVQSRPPQREGYTAVRGFMFHDIGIPSFVLENAGGGRFDLAGLVKSMEREKRVYYAVLDQLIAPSPVKPTIHPTVKMTFPDARNYKVYKVAKPPVIDGKLDEDCWKHPSVITNFTTGGRRPQQQGKTTVRVVYDDKNLYVAYEVPDLKPSKITGHDASVWTEDGADFMFDTNLNRWTYFQFQANANGAFADTYWAIPGIPEGRHFNVKDYQVAGSVENGAIEIRIPFAAFNGYAFVVDPKVPSPPTPGTVWGVNFFRNKPSTSWAPMSDSAHAPWQFNAMTFTGETK